MVRNETIGTLNRWFLSASVVFITLVALTTSHAATLAGVSLPEQAMGGQERSAERPEFANRHHAQG